MLAAAHGPCLYCGPLQNLLIADCRPRANAMANKAGGWGYESYIGCQLEFLGMHNIHAIRDADK
jgi:hypothetical protein